MRRTTIAAVLAGVGILILRSRMPKLHERLMERCEAMFERMPDSFPPKKMMLTIEEVRATTARIEQSLQARPEAPVPKADEAVHHAA